MFSDRASFKTFYIKNNIAAHIPIFLSICFIKGFTPEVWIINLPNGFSELTYY